MCSQNMPWPPRGGAAARCRVFSRDVGRAPRRDWHAAAAAGRRLRRDRAGPSQAHSSASRRGEVQFLGATPQAAPLLTPAHPASATLPIPQNHFLAAVGVGVEPVHIVAQSMGGSFAYPFVVSNPSRVSSFTSIAAVALEREEARLERDPKTAAALSSVPALMVWGERRDPLCLLRPWVCCFR